MPGLQELKADLQINSELTEIVDALKVVAVSEFWQLDEKRKERSSTFLEAFEGFFRMLDFSSIEHPFARDKTGKLTLIILTSDERFMGGLNKRIVDTALEYPSADSAEIAVVGIQGADYLRTLQREHTHFDDLTSRKPFEAVSGLRDFVIEKGRKGEMGRLVIIYPKPVSFLIQTVEALPVLPCTELLFLEKRELRKRRLILEAGEEVICDSTLEQLIEYLVRAWIAEKFIEVFEDARQAELSAKAVRLEESHEGLESRRDNLTHQYHRTHHEMLDKGMRETFSAQVMRRGNAG